MSVPGIFWFHRLGREGVSKSKYYVLVHSLSANISSLRTYGAKDDFVPGHLAHHVPFWEEKFLSVCTPEEGDVSRMAARRGCYGFYRPAPFRGEFQGKSYRGSQVVSSQYRVAWTLRRSNFESVSEPGISAYTK